MQSITHDFCICMVFSQLGNDRGCNFLHATQIGIGLDASEMVYVLLQSCDRLFCPYSLGIL